MVGFVPEAEIKLNTFEYGVAGSISGICSRALLQPLDVVKIRFQFKYEPPFQLQLQVEPIRRDEGKYHGMFQAARTIAKEEGVFGLWKGHVPAQGLSVVYGVVQFGCFELLTKDAWKYLPAKLVNEYQPLTNFLCGAVSGALAMTAALPLDVIRTRLIAQGEPKVYANLRCAIRLMYTKEGILSFYRGFIPSTLMIAPSTGFQFMFYGLFARLWTRAKDRTSFKDATNGFETLVCGSLAGLSAKLCVYPLDLLKKRVQIIQFEHARVQHGRSPMYNGLIHCFKHLLLEEGFLGLFKGLLPSLLKASTASGCTFFFYEQTCRLLRLSHQP